jgi:DNA segregation ATPase FtsK/SpoIIIE, S-DNA-T family
MSTVVVHRPARIPPPWMPTAPIAVIPPPAVQRDETGALAWMQYTLPAAGSLGALVFIIVQPRAIYIAGGLLFAFSAIAVGVLMGIQQRRSQHSRNDRARARYLVYLADIRRQARAAAAAQRAATTWRHPAPEALWQLASTPARLWERRPGDADFLCLRAGRGEQPLLPGLVQNEADALAELEPASAVAVQRLVEAHSTVPGLPIALDLMAGQVVSVVAAPETGRGVARAMVCQLAALHSPDEARLSVCTSPEAQPAWEWCKWLPHLRQGAPGDVEAPLPVLFDETDLQTLIEEEVLARRRLTEAGRIFYQPGQTERPADAGRPALVVVVDRVKPAGDTIALLNAEDARGICLITLSESRHQEPPRVDLRVTVDPAGALEVQTAGSTSLSGAAASIVGRGQADLPGIPTCEAFARRLAPLRPASDTGRQALATELGLLPLLGVADIGAIDPTTLWGSRTEAGLLAVPIGLTSDGQPLVLDLKEPAFGGHGPHGIVIGATGSGKSELLRTLVTALALTHSPDALAMILTDFKGGATFAGLAPLPHVAGMITNLADDLALVDRMRDAMFGEIQRRQEMLNAAGNLASLRDYQRHRLKRPDLPPLPHLLVIVDEFSELLTAKPDFIDLFVAIGRVGRSLGIHLLLASQQLDEGRLRGLEGHLSYRIALRTFNALESQVVIDTADAYHLPRLAGSGYLKVGTEVYTRFRAAFVSEPHRTPEARGGADTSARRFSLIDVAVARRAPAAGSAIGEAQGTATLDVVAGRLERAAPKAHQVWLPPLDAKIGLAEVAGPAQPTGELQVPIGILDLPAMQTKTPLILDLAQAGNLVVVGAPQTGKSTLLRTLLLSTALNHTPHQAQFYCLDLGGGSLGALANLPHSGGISDRADRERTRAMVRQVWGLLRQREHSFHALGIDSPAALRRARSTAAPDDPLAMADVFLCIDNWAAFRADFDDLEDSVQEIAAQGPGFGIHVIVTANRWLELRPALLDNIGGRLELRLNDPLESLVDRQRAANLAGMPGRGLTADGFQFQVALPSLDQRVSMDNLQRGVEDLARQIASGWHGASAPAVRMLPARLYFSDLPAPGLGGPGVPIGLGETNLQPVFLDLPGGDPHLLVFGESGSGKTCFLRTYLLGLIARMGPSQAQALLIDYRRTLLGDVGPDYLMAYAGSAAAAIEQVGQLEKLLAERFAPADVTVEQLSDRSWWMGPEIYVVVDDYDLVTAGAEHPLLPLIPLLGQARDLGFHVLLSRRCGGASRAMFEPFLMALKEMTAQGLLLSGDPQEGPLIGDERASPQPPGRGLFVRRSQRELVQVALTPARSDLVTLR